MAASTSAGSRARRPRERWVTLVARQTPVSGLSSFPPASQNSTSYDVIVDIAAQMPSASSVYEAEGAGPVGFHRRRQIRRLNDAFKVPLRLLIGDLSTHTVPKFHFGNRLADL
jgi:hypothetical protein